MADLLAEYYATTSRYSPQLGGRDGVRGRIDAIVNELGLPAALDADGDWLFASDVGDFILLVDPDGDVVVWQMMRVLHGRLKNHADVMMTTLLLNFEAAGSARFSALGKEDGQYAIVISGRMPGEDADRATVERLLADAMRLSRELDRQAEGEEATPAAPAQAPAAAAAPPAWYPDPQGGGGQRWWDGAQWTGHTAP